MIVPLPRRQRTSEDNVLPLINIVFLLLIFFMMAGALSASAPFQVEPPAASEAGKAPAPTGGISIAAGGRIALAGEVVALEALPERVRAWKRDAGSRMLTVRADGGAASDRLVAVMGALRRAGIERVRVLAIARGGGA